MKRSAQVSPGEVSVAYIPPTWSRQAALLHYWTVLYPILGSWGHVVPEGHSLGRWIPFASHSFTSLILFSAFFRERKFSMKLSVLRLHLLLTRGDILQSHFLVSLQSWRVWAISITLRFLTLTYIHSSYRSLWRRYLSLLLGTIWRPSSFWEEWCMCPMLLWTSMTSAPGRDISSGPLFTVSHHRLNPTLYGSHFRLDNFSPPEFTLCSILGL